MGLSAHLPFETISAYLDGELSQPEHRAAQQHLAACQGCSAELAAFGRVDTALSAPAQVDCVTALTFLSALQDRELTLEEGLVGHAHVATCATCRADSAAWSRLDAALAALPQAQPSRRVDAAVAAIPGRARGRRQTPGRGLVSGVAVRAAVVVGLVIAVAIAGVQQPPAAQRATQPPETAAQAPLPPIAPRQVIVASAQQTLLNPRTNTLYLAHTEAGTVGAVNATSLTEVATIAVGGRPSALALNVQANTVLVLDSTQKLLSEIDGNTNTLIGQTPINVSGTPNALQVDSTNGRILIAVTEPTTPQSATPSGAVVVLDSSSKKLETTNAVAVAPQQVVADARGARALLVSPDVVTLVDASTYKPLDQLPGGVGAVFSAKSDTVAILSATGTGSKVTIVGDENAALTLRGSPVSIVALPRGGYAVLTDEGLNGRILEIAADGTPGRNVSVSLVGRELSYNAQSGQYTVAGSGGVAITTITTQLAVTTPAPTAANAKPSVSPPTAVSVVVAPTASSPARPTLPDGATLAWQGMYRLDLVGHGAPTVVGRGRSGHLWFVDSANRLTSLDAVTGDAYIIAELPREARIRSIEVGSAYVYAIDVAASRVYIVALSSEKESVVQLPFVKSSAAVTVTPDDRLWFAVADKVLTLDPRDGKIEAATVAPKGVGALAADSAGRVWFSDESEKRIGLYDRSASLVTELALARTGAVSGMIVDSAGTLWVGTDAGELFAVRGGALAESAMLPGPVLGLALDPQGAAWYLAGDAGRTSFGRTQAPSRAKALPGSIVGLWFDPRGDAWLGDRSSTGFFIAVPEAR